jgi:[histone H3]-dimethyl-L-lysine9 demethylase
MEKPKSLLYNEDPMNSYSMNGDDDEDDMMQTEKSDSQEVDSKSNGKKKHRRGRPKGSANREGSNKRPANKRKTDKPSDPAPPQERLPRMKANVHNIRLTDEQIAEYKREQTAFPQPGVCYIIAPHLYSCVECAKMRGRGRKSLREVDCRFYQFRKLRYEGDNLIFAGFSDPFVDPKEIDTSIWIPSQDRIYRGLSVSHARLILAHVGDELCQLIEKEKIYYQTYKSASQPMIWKRPIDRVLEICDLCSTTLFNYHFICIKCGLSLCVDCDNEKNKSLSETKCTVKDDRDHDYKDFHMTQIIPSDLMEKLQRMLHDICEVWLIQHDCKQKTEPIMQIDRTMRSIIYNILIDGEGSKTFMSRELACPFKQIDIDLHSIKIDEAPELFNENVKVPESQPPVKHLRTIRYHTKLGKENVISISRSVNQLITNEFYGDVPHKWICGNKLLRLLDPQHPGNEDFFCDQWQRGHPVMVSNVLDHFKKEYWLPQSFSNEFGSQISDFINCMNGNLVRNKEIAVFWDGFEIVEKRLKDNEGRPMLLKLKDWPPDRE